MIEPTADQPFVPFSALMAKVGYFLFYWSFLEHALNIAILEARRDVGLPASRICGTFPERLDNWFELAKSAPRSDSEGAILAGIKRQALSLRKIRNNVVHGLIAGNSMPVDGMAHIECALGGHDNPSGETVSYSIDDLDHFTQAIDACRRAFSRLDAFNYDLDSRYESTPPNNPGLP